MKDISRLASVLKEGNFIVTAEIGPPKNADAEKIRSKAQSLKEYADAFNLTDNQTAVVRLSSLAGSILIKELGLEPIMQITCRDRNRLALQSDILGACALGIRNVLCLTGDHQSFGNHPQTKGVYDIDSIQLLSIYQNMRDNHRFASGDIIKEMPPKLFLGAAINPFAEPYDFRIQRLEKKIDAGAQFIQTQSVYNIDFFMNWIDEVHSSGLDKKVHILAGVTPLKSIKMTERMKFVVPGVDIPDEIYNRMKQSTDQKAEGYAIALDTIRELRHMQGLHGIHITALFWEDIIPRLVQEAGLFPRPA
jgi:methylenetetrahydrofolate reductase (NADPH)